MTHDASCMFKNYFRIISVYVKLSKYTLNKTSVGEEICSSLVIKVHIKVIFARSNDKKKERNTKNPTKKKQNKNAMKVSETKFFV